MRLKEWQTSLICEICMVGGSNGINITTFWSFVEELKPKYEKELVSVNEIVEFEDFEEKEIVEKELIIDDDFKAWFWKEFVNLEQVILGNEEKTADSAQLKLNTYQEIEKSYSAVVVIIEEKIRDQIIYKNVDPEKVTKEWKELLYYICKHRYSGVLTTDLSDVFKKDAKTIFTRVKELVNLGLM
ncbi:hypothetical protein K502DRAFT_166812 [Neoconidiobolus thromboides FSU 785]|nr:hypothetical protein K502DRAFT_166812 [Neoconidiobolus thromboides FSU 785]